MNSKNIIITTIVHPENIYHGITEDEPIRQLIRRIDKITETNNKNILGDDVMLCAAPEQSVGNTEPHFAINENVLDNIDLEEYLM